MAERIIRSTQPRVSMGPSTVNYRYTSGGRTRAQIVSAYETPVNGNDSTANKEQLPGEWTLVKETNMESREPQDVWRKSTLKTTHHLSQLLKQSLLQHPHPRLSKDALNAIETMRADKGPDY